MTTEWTAATATAFWPDQRGHWAPVSWKDHLYDFSVFFNGTIAANPAGVGLNHNVLPEDQVFAAELRLKIMTGAPTAAACDQSVIQLQHPDGLHVASWAPGKAPVYVIEHKLTGAPILVEQRQFAHVPGGRAVRRGDEPHFLWVRLAVTDVLKLINPADRLYVCLTFLAPSTLTGMGAFNNINFNYGYGAPWYPLGLNLEGPQNLTRPAVLRLAPPVRVLPRSFVGGKRNRLAVPAGQRGVTVESLQGQLFAAHGKSLTHLLLSFPSRPGATADFLLPMIPVDDATLDRELALGYDRALAETERFWTRELQTRTAVRVSEPLLQGWLDNFPRLEAMIGERHPLENVYGLPSGSFHYESIWTTPLALQAYALEFTGYGHEVAKYIDVYRQHQGQNKPPSPYLGPHPGYFGSPRTFASIDWITDHAAVLWMAANHGLHTMDKSFLRQWRDPIVQACEFIVTALHNRKHPGYKGILPAAVANDCDSSSQSGWNDAWTHKALRTAARLLTRLGHPRATRYRREADAYRRAFQKAYRAVVAKSQIWRAPDGTRVPFTPPTLSAAKGFEAAHAFHLDTGALSFVFGELFPASDPVMRAALRWFREGPQVKSFRPFSSEWQTPTVFGEISSCEPCYSWNIFHSYELGDRPAFTQGLYGLYAGGGSRQNFVSCETRDAVSGNCFTHGIALMLTRLAVIREAEDELHLLPLTPLAFFAGDGFSWRNVPTEFGDVSIAGRYDAAARTLRLTYRAPARQKPSRTLLHLPPLDGLQRVILNGKALGRVQGVVEL
ncbi:hypothetical protein HQ590_09365 [bacterium]|nr:hypothetical protein [bacterium]